MKQAIKSKWTRLDAGAIAAARMLFGPLARVAFFVVFFWFGFTKLTGASPAEGLAEAMTAKTIGAQYFDTFFKATGVFECFIGVLFLIPRLTRAAIVLLFVHMVIVAGPIVLVPDMTWQSFMVPTLEGQYIIKNITLIALAIGLAANLKPLSAKAQK